MTRRKNKFVFKHNFLGSIDHLEIDAQSLADWGVDFIKMDGCNVETNVMVDGYIEFGRLMNKTGRPIVS
jgi:alpha-galactosidase